jgi:uncharacterized protein (UPF0332 family)
MDGSEFLSVVLRLLNSNREADLRSAVSRAYYGVFHIARALVEECGVTLPKAAQAHDKLQWCLSQSGHPDAVLAAAKLSSLRADRNEADYDIQSARFRSPMSVQIIIRAAQEIVIAVSICNSEPHLSNLRPKIRAFAKDHLQLPVTEI